MPLILIARFLLGLLSLGIIAAGAYFLWLWFDGALVVDSEGIVHRVREEWPLWVAGVALAWSLLGGFALRPFLAKADRRVFRSERSNGRTVISPTGSTLYVEEHGDADAPKIIFTHGWGLDSTIWGYAVDDLKSSFRVITWDLPGLGLSKGKVALEEFAADLKAVIDLDPVGPVVLVGHSIGGMTIQTLARDDPSFIERRVAGIVLLNTTYVDPLRTMLFSPLLRLLRWPVIEPLLWLTIPLQPVAWLMAWQSYLSGSAHLANRLGFGKHVTHSQLEATTLLSTRNSPAAQARGNLAMFRWDATGAMAKVRVPIVILAGSLDIVTKPEASQVIADSANRAKLSVVEAVNHMGLLERYDIYNRAIGEFAADALSKSK